MPRLPPSTISNRLESRGLQIAGVGASAIQLLAELATKPLPMVKGRNRWRNPQGPSNKPWSIAYLITPGFAQLNRDRSCYEITDKGREYLQKLVAAKILKSSSSFPLTSAK